MTRQKTHPGQAWLLAGNISLNLPDDRPIVSSGTFTRANPPGDEPGVFLTFAGRHDGYMGAYWLHMSPATADRVAVELLQRAEQTTRNDLIDALDYAAEDLAYRVEQGRDYDDPTLANERIARYRRLIERLSAPVEKEMT